MMDDKCLECGHFDSEHKDGAGPVWPCEVRGCDCYDVLLPPVKILLA